ncbi:hypothetical protein [Candidatus Vampirococcus lugosii]|uniref:Uncharacterized protein n=1 Tax=Candidatus Vampirococcus lugosii TaxID=2789015 RepID=A0ABS5QN35_9BACT|nr:hypothetical protein [Candidatus Vampirococcus lugosii]MBS8122138.1 hypothetical protein [Candidatus Vampirococcus lugosii]
MDRLSENKNVNSESKNLGVNKEIYDIIEGSGAKIEKTNLGLSINLGEKKDNKLFLKKLIGEIYKGGYCIQDINIFGIMECVNNGKKSLILGAGFKKFDSYEKEIYESKLKIESNCAKFDFFVTYDEETDTEFNAEYDKVIMTLLQNGIVYGINYDLINNVVNGLEAKSIQVVAESEEVQEFKDGMKKSYIKYLKGGKSNKAIKEESIVRDLCSKNDSDKAHRSSYKQMFPMTFAYEGLNIIAELVAPKSGKTYRDMFGNDVSISSNNIDLKDYSGEGTKIRNVDGVQQIIATKDGYVDIDPKTGKINLLTKADYSGNIDEETGSLNILAPEFNLQGDIKKMIGIIS